MLTASLSIFRWVILMPICWNPFWMIWNAVSPAPDSSLREQDRVAPSGGRSRHGSRPDPSAYPAASSSAFAFVDVERQRLDRPSRARSPAAGGTIVRPGLRVAEPRRLHDRVPVDRVLHRHADLRVQELEVGRLVRAGVDDEVAELEARVRRRR